jgi:hypothetical protein
MTPCPDHRRREIRDLGIAAGIPAQAIDQLLGDGLTIVDQPDITVTLRVLVDQPEAGRPCCDHCNNREGDPGGHDYGDESAHDGPCAECDRGQSDGAT